MVNRKTTDSDESLISPNTFLHKRVSFFANSTSLKCRQNKLSLTSRRSSTNLTRYRGLIFLWLCSQVTCCFLMFRGIMSTFRETDSLTIPLIIPSSFRGIIRKSDSKAERGGRLIFFSGRCKRSACIYGRWAKIIKKLQINGKLQIYRCLCIVSTFKSMTTHDFV